VLELLGEPLDLIGYGPHRTRLVFPEGSFNAQVGIVIMHQDLKHPLYRHKPLKSTLFEEDVHVFVPTNKGRSSSELSG
jgi:hypothetical protein